MKNQSKIHLRLNLLSVLLIIAVQFNPSTIENTTYLSSESGSARAMSSSTDPENPIYLPVILANYAASNDQKLLYWSQAYDESSRNILLRWHGDDQIGLALSFPNASTGITYKVVRRVAGSIIWTVIGETHPAVDAQEMSILLGHDLTEQLSYDLRNEGFEDPLTAAELYTVLMSGNPKVLKLSEVYYEINQVRGTAYLDIGAPLGVDLEYQVTPLSALNSPAIFTPYRSIRIGPADTTEPVSGLVEVWPGPVELGKRGSNQPYSAPERWSWDDYQQYRPWDGNVFLNWELPEGLPVQDEDGTLISPDKNAIIGYLVMRTLQGTSNWEIANTLREPCRSYDPLDCVILANESANIAVAGGVTYQFKDPLKDIFSDPAQIYTGYDYKVCTLDWFRSVSNCTGVITGYGRDIDPPAIATNLTVTGTLPAEVTTGDVNITLIYSDTQELNNNPLRFFVTRSADLTLPADQWTPIYPGGGSDPFVSRTGPGPFKITVYDSPPVDQLFWYRVQVRDNAGNWSPLGTPKSGARYTRTPTDLPNISYNSQDCSLNPMPLVINGINPAIVLVTVYGSFDQTNWLLVKRVPVEDGSASFMDDYLPPHPTTVYYTLEGVDAHGNISLSQQHYCAVLGETGPPSLPFIHLTTEPGDQGTLIVEIDIANSTGTNLIRVERGGEVYTDTIETGWENYTLYPGEVVGFTTYNVNGEFISEGVTNWVRHTNNYLDTDRQLTDLGSMFSISWDMSNPADPKVNLNLTGPCDQCGERPYAAAFRRIPGGNWMQVTPVSPVATTGDLSEPWMLVDTADPTPTQTYEYVVLAFDSPGALVIQTTYEMLGFWGPQTLPKYSTPTSYILNNSIEPNPDWPSGCSYALVSPGDASMPDIIALDNGWKINVTGYKRSTDAGCPTSISYDKAYGVGNLANASQTWPVEFNDIGIDPGSSALNRGRIVVDVAHSVNMAGYFLYVIKYLEFIPNDSYGDINLTLPENIKMGDETHARSNKLQGRFADIQPDWTFDPLLLKATLNRIYLVDENLPWRLNFESIEIGAQDIGFEGGVVDTSDRLGYTPPSLTQPSPPDNNLGYLRVNYLSTDAAIFSDGLKGNFHTEINISYATSLPAGMVITADSADVSINASMIDGGGLYDAQATLEYFETGSLQDYMVKDLGCTPMSAVVVRYGVCRQAFGVPGLQREKVTFTPYADPDSIILVGAGGRLVGEGDTNLHPTWEKFQFTQTYAHLFVAAAAFGGTPASWAPMPAENAWKRISEPLSGGDLDPGLNFNDFEVGINWYAYPDSPSLSNVSYDLYIRRGGVSEYLLKEAGPDGYKENPFGYEEKPIRLEFKFYDNLQELLDYQADLYLPYPSDVIIPLEANPGLSNSGDAFPTQGNMRSVLTYLHKYWNFEHTSHAWRYKPTTFELYGDIALLFNRIFCMYGDALIPGLHRQSTTDQVSPVYHHVSIDWFPNGDAGNLSLEIVEGYEPDYRISGLYFALSDVKLSRYYSVMLDDTSLPDLMGVVLANNLTQPPDRLLDTNGNLTPQSLKECSMDNAVGCGFILLDGMARVDYFGELNLKDPSSAKPVTGYPLDELVGGFPVVVNAEPEPSMLRGTQDITGVVTMLLARAVQIPMVWTLANPTIDAVLAYFDLPVVFMGNTYGGALAAVLHDFEIHPDMFLEGLPQVLTADFAAVITVDWNSTRGYQDHFAMFLGYPASQGAFRELALNLHNPLNGGTLPVDRWFQVEQHIIHWAGRFAYTVDGDRSNKNDPVDLAKQIWESEWCEDGDDPGSWSGDTCLNRLGTDQTFNILEPIVHEADTDEYGVVSLSGGAMLQGIGVDLYQGVGQFYFTHDGFSDWRMDMLQIATRMESDLDDGTLFLYADWIFFELNRDGEVKASGRNIHVNLLGVYEPDLCADFDFQMQYNPNLFEGGITLRNLWILGLATADLAGVYGAGGFQTDTGVEEVWYVGGRADIELSTIYLNMGLSLLFGTIPTQSWVLERQGFGELMNKFSAEDVLPDTLDGFYLAAYGEWPLVEGSCAFNAAAELELRGWYFEGSTGDTWGGQLRGSVWATVLCVVSGRGTLTLTVEHMLPGAYVTAPPGEPGWPLSYRQCSPSNDCYSFSGSFWIAVGIGWCEPGDWDSWTDVWHDSWCYTIGAYIYMNYLDYPARGDAVDWDYEIEFE